MHNNVTPSVPPCRHSLTHRRRSHPILAFSLPLKAEYWRSHLDHPYLVCALHTEQRGGIRRNKTASNRQCEAATDETQGEAPRSPETRDVISEESDNLDDTEESSDQAAVDSDEDWEPRSTRLLTNGLQKEGEAIDDNQLLLDAKHKHLCEECGSLYARLGRHTCEHKTKPFSCNICGQRLTTEYALNAHRRIHSESYLFSCKYCYVTVKTKVDKVNHEQTHLNEEKPYKCSDCSETFATHTERKIHLEDHRGPPQLKCDICHLEFLNNNSLRRHYIVHTGTKPFKCSICQRSFSQASHLKSHVRLHTGERPFKCQQCDKCFNHNSCLKNHIQRYHTGSSGSERNDRKSGKGSKLKKRTTGRPIGRPKRNTFGNSVLSVKEEDQCLKPVTVQEQEQKGEECHDEEGQDNITPSDSAGEDKESVPMAKKRQARKRGRPKKSAEKEDGKKKR